MESLRAVVAAAVSASMSPMWERLFLGFPIDEVKKLSKNERAYKKAVDGAFVFTPACARLAPHALCAQASA